MERAELIALNEVLERAFDRKRFNFIEDYDLQTKPSLILQAWPASQFKVDLSSEKLREAFHGGGGPEAHDGWWHGFKGWGASLVFDGLASPADRKDSDWVSEIHVDAHIAAGVWSFPEFSKDSSGVQPGVATFHKDAFHNFTYLTSKVFGVIGVSGPVHITATMHHADKLPFTGNHGREIAPAPKRKILRWPILKLDFSELPAAGQDMAGQFLRIYGRRA